MCRPWTIIFENKLPKKLFGLTVDETTIKLMNEIRYDGADGNNAGYAKIPKTQW